MVPHRSTNTCQKAKKQTNVYSITKGKRNKDNKRQ